ncbi:hypothetical protein WH52_00295 [Tenacibaculum holothuriorum]|uniref:Lipoprotein n=1 Tax=Tenacibaculum holothuriorum TaxID=1635173 RepID=A0A1Y2PF66_9FLAO|nr:hypothetical protein [Tenacibaculum holothuriorum]OSY89133.1 hypothetical protein WH52_00295 [Tenacibaculum holothuriorum]
MKKIFIAIAVLFISNVFTSCTDLEDKLVNNQTEHELQNTGGGNDQDPPEDPDAEPDIKG